MRRRDLLANLAGVALACPLPAAAQPARLPAVGVLVLGNPDPEPFLTAFRQGLQKLGYVDGRNTRLELRTAGGAASNLPAAAADLVRLNVDIIVAWQTPAAEAAKKATIDIPIVMAGVADPVGSGLVASLAKPGGNITGSSTANDQIAGKSLELIREVIPPARRVAILANATDPFTRSFLAQIGRAAGVVGIEALPMLVRSVTELDAYFEEMRTMRVDAVIVQGSVINRRVGELAQKHRLPSFALNRLLPDSGGLMSYAADFADLYRETAVYVDRILKGSKPADLPVAQPTKFELVINLKAAKALGLTIPPPILLRADEVIE